MTMAKKLPILSPSIHTFEIVGEYADYRLKDIIFGSMMKLLDEGEYKRGKRDKKYYTYNKIGGGLKIKLSSCPEYRKYYITLSGVNLSRIAREPSRLKLTDLSSQGLIQEEEIFLDELERIGIPGGENLITWKMKRVDITQDFYVKSDPTLPMKAVRYAGKVEPHGKGRAEHHKQHNEIRSCRFIKDKYNFELYDKHQQLLACGENERHDIRPEDIEVSKNLVRYEIQLKRPYLKDFEQENLNGMKMILSNHALFSYFEALRERIPEILYECARKMFGAHPWYHASGALERLEESNLDKKTKKLVCSYIEAANEQGKPMKCNYRKKERIVEALDILEINTVIIPDRILNKRQYARFPLAPICSRVQGIDNQSTDELYG